MRKPRIYMAGKVGKRDWRHQLLGVDRIAHGWDDFTTYHTNGWQEFELLTYVGPFFVSCDHACFHHNGVHGAASLTHPKDGHTICTALSDGPSPTQVHRRAVQGILDSNIVLAYIDKPDAYGTLFEIGFAVANKKRVVLCISDELRDIEKDFWFIARGASVTHYNTTFEKLKNILHLEVRNFVVGDDA